MQFLPEILIAVVLLLSLTFYLLAKKSLYTRKKDALLIIFKEIRTKSLHLQDILTKHIIEHDADSENFDGTMTYGQALKQLKKDHVTYLSGKKQIRIRATNNLLKLYKTESMLKKMESSLNETEKIVAHKKSAVRSA